MASNSKKKSRDNHDDDDDESVDESPARETKRRRNHTLRENVDHDDHHEEEGEPPARQRRRRNEEDDTTPTIQSFQNKWGDSHVSSSSSAMRIGAPAPETPFILFDPNHNRGDLESLRQLMALSFANSLTQSTFPGLYSSPINSLSALSMVPPHHQQLSSYNYQPVITRTMPHYENTLGWNPSLLRTGLTYNDPLASAMTMANLQSMQLANSLYGAPLHLQSSAAAAALAAARSSVQPGLPSNFSFASRSFATTAPNRNEPVANAARQLAMSGKSLSSSSPTKRRQRPKISRHLGIPLFMQDDHGTLNDQQILLRKHIEFFRATQDDILSHTRGKNKPIFVKQVGIRCIHCSHICVGRRQKGSTYFPSSLMGIYQAAQNLSVEHLQSGLCPATPPDIKKQFIKFASTKPAASGAGKKYWAEAGRMLGLVDTEEGIRFADDVRR